MKPEYQIVTTTIGNTSQAVDLAKWLVEARLARCVQIVPGVRSIYHWDDEICDDDECLLIIKTLTDNLEELMKQLSDRHPYDVPEILAVPVSAGYEPYLKWLDEWQPDNSQ